MINPLSVATNGYITPFVKKRLEVSVDGYLIETIIPPIPPTPGGGSGGGYYSRGETNEERLRKKRLEEDDIILHMIESFIKSQNFN